MSLSSRSGRAIAVATSLIAGTWAGEALPQSYFVPNVELSSEYHTNRELTSVPGQADATVGYIATLQALTGKRTQRSQTEVRPRVRFQEYPDRSGVDPVDLFLDLQSDYRMLRTKYSLLASASRQDTFNAEFGQAGIDTTGPEILPGRNDTGIVFVGVPRTEFRVQPSMDHSVSERTGLRALLRYDDVSYANVASAERQDYTDAGLEALFRHQISPLTEFDIGPYVSRYETSPATNRTDSAGATLGWKREVSEVSHMELTAGVERTRIHNLTLPNGRQTSTNWRAQLRGYRKWPASRLDYDLGRFLTGSGLGSKVERDELRVQYMRRMSPRWDYRGAVRGGSEQRLGRPDDSRDRNYVRAEFFVRWFMTQTMYISGGYRYAWQKYKGAANDASDNAALLLFGYRGLDIRRSAVRGAP